MNQIARTTTRTVSDIESDIFFLVVFERGLYKQDVREAMKNENGAPFDSGGGLKEQSVR